MVLLVVNKSDRSWLGSGRYPGDTTSCREEEYQEVSDTPIYGRWTSDTTRGRRSIGDLPVVGGTVQEEL